MHHHETQVRDLTLRAEFIINLTTKACFSDPPTLIRYSLISIIILLQLSIYMASIKHSICFLKRLHYVLLREYGPVMQRRKIQVVW